MVACPRNQILSKVRAMLRISVFRLSDMAVGSLLTRTSNTITYASLAGSF